MVKFVVHPNSGDKGSVDMYWGQSIKRKCKYENYSIKANGEIVLDDVSDNTDCVNG